MFVAEKSLARVCKLYNELNTFHEHIQRVVVLYYMVQSRGTWFCVSGKIVVYTVHHPAADWSVLARYIAALCGSNFCVALEL